MVGDLVGGRGSGRGRCRFGSSGDVSWLVLRLACGACGGILTRPCLAVLSVNTTCYECPKLVGCRNSNAQPATPARTGAGMVVVVVVYMHQIKFNYLLSSQPLLHLTIEFELVQMVDDGRFEIYPTKLVWNQLIAEDLKSFLFD